MPTKIEWARNKDGSKGETWNPVTGCSKVSDGCKNCYAQGIAKRFWKGRQFTDVQCHPDRLEQPLHWRKPRRIFVNSMSDLFHDAVPFEFIAAIFGVMAATPQHTYQILTKRPERMVEWFEWMHAMAERMHYWQWLYCCATNHISHDIPLRYLLPSPWPWPLPNVIMMVSAEDQKTADERIPLLLQTPAAARGVSLEPLLGPIDLRHLAPWDDFYTDALDTPNPSYKLNWVVIGAESGPRRRPMRQDWVRSIRDQCVAAGVPFFLKQMEVGGRMVSMPELDGKQWAEFPR